MSLNAYFEEYWKPILQFPGYQISSEGRIRNYTTGEFVEYWFQNGIPYAQFESYEVTFRGAVWIQMAYVWFRLNVRRVQVSYRDDDPTNLSMFNLLWSDENDVPILFYLDETGEWRRKRGPEPRKIQIIETGEVFDSAVECAKKINGDPRAIYACIRGRLKSHRNFTFKWVEETSLSTFQTKF